MPGRRFPGVYQRCRRELVDGREVWVYEAS
jgi:hypothetical protein